MQRIHVSSGNYPIAIHDWETEWDSQEVWKYLWRLSDGAVVESVDLGFPTLREDRYLCLSTQVGCPVACKFCATGNQKYQRNMTAQEIADEFLAMADSSRVALSESSVVTALFYGMGEPSLNEGGVNGGIELISEKYARVQFSISTVCANMVAIRRWIDDARIYRMQFSLHAPDDDRRQRLMRSAVSVREIVEAAAAFGRRRGVIVPINYILIDGFNDSPGDAEAVARLTAPCADAVSVKLTVLNENQAASQFGMHASSMGILKEFKNIVEQYGVRATIQDITSCAIGASCGQLRYHSSPSQAVR